MGACEGRGYEGRVDGISHKEVLTSVLATKPQMNAPSVASRSDSDSDDHAVFPLLSVDRAGSIEQGLEWNVR